MAKYAVALALLLCVSVPVVAMAEEPNDKTWQTYVDSTYQVTFRFPGDWKRDPVYTDRPYFGVERRPNAVRKGFFQLLVMGDENHTPEELCKGLAEHHLKPFGETPTIRQMDLQGQGACLVWPSKDQGGPWDAALVVKYPEPVEIDGERYSFLFLDADKDYILAITRTLRFISPTHPGAPFLISIAPKNESKTGTGEWKAGAPVSVILTMKNTSQRVLHLVIADPAIDCRMTVLNSKNGERLPVSDNFRKSQNGLKEGRASVRNVLKTLKPQETYQEAIEVSGFYDLERPGRYTVQVERDMPAELGKGIVESNTIRVTVTD